MPRRLALPALTKCSKAAHSSTASVTLKRSDVGTTMPTIWKFGGACFSTRAARSPGRSLIGRMTTK